MIDSFPYDSWYLPDGSLDPSITAYWTFGPAGGHANGGSLTGTYVLTALGILLMVVALAAWVIQERRKLDAQADKLRNNGLGA